MTSLAGGVLAGPAAWHGLVFEAVATVSQCCSIPDIAPTGPGGRSPLTGMPTEHLERSTVIGYARPMMNEPDDLERGDSAPPAPDAAPVAARDSATNKPPSLATVPTIYPPSPPLEDALHDFWGSRTAAQESAFDDAAAPADRRSIIEKLGPSPFERGGFPIVGFLATVYERVGQFARDRLKEREKG